MMQTQADDIINLIIYCHSPESLAVMVAIYAELGIATTVNEERPLDLIVEMPRKEKK